MKNAFAWKYENKILKSVMRIIIMKNLFIFQKKMNK